MLIFLNDCTCECSSLISGSLEMHKGNSPVVEGWPVVSFELIAVEPSLVTSVVASVLITPSLINCTVTGKSFIIQFSTY